MAAISRLIYIFIFQNTEYIISGYKHMIYFVYKIFIQFRIDYVIISHIKNLFIFKLYKFFVDFRGKGLTGL